MNYVDQGQQQWLGPDRRRRHWNSKEQSVSRDLLRGAREIAVFLFGTPAARRRVYDLHAEGVLPTFTLGKSICARRSSLMTWIENQERRSGEVA